MVRGNSGESDRLVRRPVGRRGLLAGAAAGAVVVTTTGEATATGRSPTTSTSTRAAKAGPYTRSDVWSLGTPWDPMTVAYARAVSLMQSRPSEDPTSWSFQAAIHGTFRKPPHPAWNDCQHQSWYFLPWHRMFVYFFERIVRAAVLQTGGPANWALPYWNYDRPFPANTLPAAFREPALPDGTANPLFLPTRRSAAMMDGFQLTTRMTSSSQAMAATSFASNPSRSSFGGGAVAPAQFAGSNGALERQPHNVVHVQVGGKGVGKCEGPWMSVIRCAANDPVFWLHHANIDRLWGVWLAQGGARANPTETAWRDQSFNFFDETGSAVSMTPAAVLDTLGQLGYAYA